MRQTTETTETTTKKSSKEENKDYFWVALGFLGSIIFISVCICVVWDAPDKFRNKIEGKM